MDDTMVVEPLDFLDVTELKEEDAPSHAPLAAPYDNIAVRSAADYPVEELAAAHGLTRDEVILCRGVFNEIDTDYRSSLSMEELRASLERLAGVSAKPE